MLKRLGLDADLAADGQQAVSLCEQNAYDLILMDCQMPGLDGQEAARAIRDLETRLHRPHATIIALTANALPGDRQECLAAGMDDFLGKPFKAAELGAVLSRWLGEAHVPGLPTEAVMAEASPDTLPCIDDGVLGALRESFGPDFELLLETFLESTPDMLEQLFAAWVEGDAEGLGRVAHGLRSAAQTFGASHLAHLLAGLETQAGGGRLEDIGEQLQLVRHSYTQVADRLSGTVRRQAQAA
jgi:CheY-like chemotaxis protein/HPt (histidine-containing phosphotransfer) domain-containing protein